MSINSSGQVRGAVPHWYQFSILPITLVLLININTVAIKKKCISPLGRLSFYISWLAMKLVVVPTAFVGLYLIVWENQA